MPRVPSALRRFIDHRKKTVRDNKPFFFAAAGLGNKPGSCLLLGCGMVDSKLFGGGGAWMDKHSPLDRLAS
jgi:hypothetical protein